MQTISWDDFCSLVLKRAMSRWFLCYMFNGKKMNWKNSSFCLHSLLLSVFLLLVVVALEEKDLVMVVVVVVMVVTDYRNEVGRWRKNTWNGGGGGGVGGFGEGIKKMRRSQITEFRVSKSYNQYNICWHIPTKRGLSHLSLLLATLTREGRGIQSTRSWAEHISLIRDSVSNVFTTYGSFFFALFSIHELPAKNQWNGNGTILEIICNTFWKELGIELPLFRYGTLMLSHIRWFLFSKSKTSIDLKMAKQPVKHVESHNRAGERDYKISKPFHSRDQGKRPRHYRR